MDPSSKVSQLLDAWNAGDPEALDLLMPLIAEELRSMARQYFRGENSSHTLQPTALVAEVYMKFRGQRKVQWRSRAEFFRVASRSIRNILVDYARRRKAQKRGRDFKIEPIDEAFVVSEDRAPELIALDDALRDLAKLDPRGSRVVELSIFGGLEFQDIAKLEEVSRTTIWRDWNSARLWLARELRGDSTDTELETTDEG